MNHTSNPHGAGEYISREAANKMIDEAILGASDFAQDTRDACHEAINSVKPADVVPVVRCMDCRFYAKKQSSLCDMHHRAVNVDDYCNYGVRMNKDAGPSDRRDEEREG